MLYHKHRNLTSKGHVYQIPIITLYSINAPSSHIAYSNIDAVGYLVKLLRIKCFHVCVWCVCPSVRAVISDIGWPFRPTEHC